MNRRLFRIGAVLIVLYIVTFQIPATASAVDFTDSFPQQSEENLYIGKEPIDMRKALIYYGAVVVAAVLCVYILARVPRKRTASGAVFVGDGDKDVIIKISAAFLLVVACALSLTFIYRNSNARDEKLIYSQPEMLHALWERFKVTGIEASSGRTLDKQRSFISTSEGQGYTMLRAVWMGDKAVFDRSWQWTKDNLQHEDDALFAWLFGLRRDSTYGVITEEGGNNAASDGDTDIALALVFAYSRWRDPAYLQEAYKTIVDIWNKEVVVIQGRPYISANDLFNSETSAAVLLNPSYFSPYAYRIFAEIDTAHDWRGLVDTSYEILEKSSKSNLDRRTSSGLPPDWIELDVRTGDLLPPRNIELTTNYGYDAMRVPWRIGLDWIWYHEPRAQKYLDSITFLNDEWKKRNLLYSTYTHDGTPVMRFESPAMYGASLAYFMTRDMGTATAVYKQKIESLYDPDAQAWKSELGYYDENLAWFGLALYNGALVNLYDINFR